MRMQAAEWMPDQPPLEAPGAGQVQNCVPIARGYAPFKGPAAVSTNAIASAATGYFAARNADSSVTTIIGEKSHLYIYTNGAFTDVSRPIPSYGPQGPSSFWEFVQFGQRIIAVTYENSIQYYDIGASSKFGDLPGNPPLAHHAAVVRTFLVLGNTSNSESEIVWSGNNDTTIWTPEVKESSNQILLDGGAVQGIIGGEVGFILQERQIVRMTYVGPPLHFQFDVIQSGYGTQSPYSYIRADRSGYFVGLDGFKALSLDTGALTPIGAERVDRWFQSNAAAPALTNIRASLDPIRKMIWWSFADLNPPVTTFNHAIGYNWQLNKWTHVVVDHDLLSNAFTEALSMDTMDGLYPNLDLIPFSLDSYFWLGGLLQFRGFNASHQLVVFEGATLQATIETVETEPTPGARSVVQRLRPLTDSPDATVAIEYRERLMDAPSMTVATAVDSLGYVHELASGRYIKTETIIPAGSSWTQFQGCDLDTVRDGEY